MSYTCIRVEGGLISPDFLESIHEQVGQTSSDFGLDAKRSIIDEVSSVWADARAYWIAFQRRLARAKDESVTTITREQWVIPLLETLGYDLIFQRKAPEVDGRIYAISHTAGEENGAPPIHVVAFDQDLDKRPPAGRGTMSPHALVQDFLNRTEELWGAVTNGMVFRLLRDSSYFTRPAYIEFDLGQILEGERLDEFIFFYRIAHRTRLPRSADDAPDCLLERYHLEAIEQGGRIRDGLRDAVEASILNLGNGFLAHPHNEALREEVRTGALSPRSFYKQLLYLIYRMLFLMVAEERGLLAGDSDGAERTIGSATEPYSEYFSFSRLRKLADTPLSAPGRFDDLYLGFRSLSFVLRDEKLAGKLGLPPLNGELFYPLDDLEDASLSNQTFLEAVAAFSYFTPKEDKVRRRVNYGALDVEELGSVYESLLDYQPVFTNSGVVPGFALVVGLERKTTGSYYTRPELVSELVFSALVPVMEERLGKAGKDQEKKEKALLALRVCDPACGSGHFLLAAARRIARELAKVRTETEEPSPDSIRTAVRDVITHCIYGVDKNPLAVDLCKVALWIEGHSGNKPLTFLDHRIRRGDSLVGVLDMNVLKDGIPDDAYNPVAGDERALAQSIKRRNSGEKKDEPQLPFGPEEDVSDLVSSIQGFLDLPDDSPEQVNKKRRAYQELHGEGTKWWNDELACNLWTSAFFVQLTEQQLERKHIPTTDDLRGFLQNPNSIDGRLAGNAWALQARNSFFHWPLEFPDIFKGSGFDVVLSNPPWERVKLQEQEFFASRNPEIAAAPNKAARKKLIQQLADRNPALWYEYQDELHNSDALSKFLRASRRFPLTARGDINTYSVFAELFRKILGPRGRAGILCPTGIATDDTNKTFFGDLILKQSLAQFLGMDNEAMIFPGIDHRNKFGLLTISGTSITTNEPIFTFACSKLDYTKFEERRYTLSASDFDLLNPNTGTCPVFRTKMDAELTKKIYGRMQVLVNEKAGENPWGVSFLRMFDMANDSHLFRTSEQLEGEGYRLQGNRFVKDDDTCLPLYEAKMIWQFDHRYATYEGATQANLNSGSLPKTSPEEKADPGFAVMPRYWVSKSAIDVRLSSLGQKLWLMGFRDITSAIVERTVIASLLPVFAVGHTMPLVFSDASQNHLSTVCLFTNLNTITLDYIARQKVGGTHLTYSFLKQFPVLPPWSYPRSAIDFIIPRALELLFTSWDVKSFADDVWRDSDEALRRHIQDQWDQNYAVSGSNPSVNNWAADEVPFAPFQWNEDRRAGIRAALDAYYAQLYGLTEEELRYILDPIDVYGPDFPGETFRVLKEKEIKQYGEYRTKRLIMDAWGRLTNELMNGG
jgi:hypothetical protein